MIISKITKYYLLFCLRSGYNYISMDARDHLIYVSKLKPKLHNTRLFWVSINNDFHEVSITKIYEELCPLLDTTKYYLIENMIK